MLFGCNVCDRLGKSKVATIYPNVALYREWYILLPTILSAGFGKLPRHFLVTAYYGPSTRPGRSFVDTWKRKKECVRRRCVPPSPSCFITISVVMEKEAVLFLNIPGYSTAMSECDRCHPKSQTSDIFMIQLHQMRPGCTGHAPKEVLSMRS